MQGDDTMRDDQLTIDCRCKDLVIVEGAEIKQGVAEGVRSKSGDFGSIQFMRGNQLLNEAGLGGQGQGNNASASDSLIRLAWTSARASPLSVFLCGLAAIYDCFESRIIFLRP